MIIQMHFELQSLWKMFITEVCLMKTSLEAKHDFFLQNANQVFLPMFAKNVGESLAIFNI